MKCNHRWKTMIKKKSWICRKCGKVQTAHGEARTMEAMRDLIKGWR